MVSILHKRPQFWQSDDCYLLHDNSPSHRSQLVEEFLAKIRTKVLPYTPLCDQTYPYVTFTCSRLIFTRTLFCSIIRGSERSMAGHSTGGCEKLLPAVLPEVIQTLAEVYHPRRGLLGRWMCFRAVNYSV
ncbi:hypothetical protein TNCV_3367881 [Trichonephila clavipes]|nr:hypothetical protein TNCV_3367881 [Trichonephila clavipes]